MFDLASARLSLSSFVLPTSLASICLYTSIPQLVISAWAGGMSFETGQWAKMGSGQASMNGGDKLLVRGASKWTLGRNKGKKWKQDRREAEEADKEKSLEQKDTDAPMSPSLRAGKCGEQNN